MGGKRVEFHDLIDRDTWILSWTKEDQNISVRPQCVKTFKREGRVKRKEKAFCAMSYGGVSLQLSGEIGKTTRTCSDTVVINSRNLSIVIQKCVIGHEYWHLSGQLLNFIFLSRQFFVSRIKWKKMERDESTKRFCLVPSISIRIDNSCSWLALKHFYKCLLELKCWLLIKFTNFTFANT